MIVFGGRNVRAKLISHFTFPLISQNERCLCFSLLHCAIVQGFLEAALAIIRAAPRPMYLDTLNDDAQSALHLAVATGQSRLARWLIVAGARPSPRNLRGDSPLHISSRNGDVASCKALTYAPTQEERDALMLGKMAQPYQPCALDQWNYEG